MDSTDVLRRYYNLCDQLLIARTRREAEQIFAQIELHYPDTLSESDRLELDDWEDDEPLPDYEEWIDGVHKRQIERRRSFSEQLKKKEQIDWISLSDDDEEEKETKVEKVNVETIEVKPRFGNEPSDVLLNNAHVSLDAATPSTVSSSLATALALDLTTRSVSTGSGVDVGEVGLASTGGGSGSTVSPGTSTTTTTPVGPIAVVKRRPGRPRKSSLNATGSSVTQPSAQLVATGSYASTTASTTVSSQTVASTSFDPEPSTSTGSTTTPIVVKRGRGRPRKVVVAPVPEPSPLPSTRPKRAAALASSEKIRSWTKPRKRVVVQRQSLNQLVEQSNVQQQQVGTLNLAEEPGPSDLSQRSSSLKRPSEASTSFAASSGPKRVATSSSVSTSSFYGPSSSSSTVASTSSVRPEASNHKSGNLSTINRFRESIRGKLNNQPNIDEEIRDFGESMNPSASRVRLMVPAAKKEKLKPGPKPKKQ